MKIEHLETILAVYRCQSLKKADRYHSLCLFDRYKTYPVCGRRISRWTFWYRYATVNMSFILLFTFSAIAGFFRIRKEEK